jgi:hypothetical protein
MKRRAWPALVLALMVAGVPTVGDATATPTIRVLSNRADLISGADALVEITSADPGSMTVTAGSRDVTASFAVRPNGRLQGLLTNLPLGQIVIRVVSQGSAAGLLIDNHPVGGPVFAGGQVQPWVCRTEAVGLGPPQDEQCNAPIKHEYFYISTNPGKVGFQPYNRASPPSDVANTTTDRGVTVPFVVRRERGVIDRGVSDVAVLFNPDAPWLPWSPQRGWNGKLSWGFGGGCKPGHVQPSPVDTGDFTVLDPAPLSKGFMTASSGMGISGKSCNPVVAAEALMMTKEHIIEAYGPIRYTLGSGCSGGSIQQHFIVSQYPGLLDGILPACSFPDLWGSILEAEDCYLLSKVFDTAPGHWTEAAQRAVTGYATSATCRGWKSHARVFFDPTNADGCELPAGEVYSPATNPSGVRCTIPDYQRAMFGTRSRDGFAQRPFDTVGVQYGLGALETGQISPEDFVRLNELGPSRPRIGPAW